MMDIEKLMSIDKNNLPEAAKALEKSELPVLVEMLSEKDDNIRYRAFLLLQSRSSLASDVYLFWDAFASRLNSDNSYQRSIGLMLIAENAKWDELNRIDTVIDDYLKLLNDEKPITVRQCIQSMSKIIPAKPNLKARISKSLMSMNIAGIKDTMRKSTLIDILNILVLIRKNQTNDEIEKYIWQALSGEILDKKAKKQIETLL